MMKGGRTIDEWLEHFPHTADQKGLLVMVYGKVVGFDMVSRMLSGFFIRSLSGVT